MTGVELKRYHNSGSKTQNIYAGSATASLPRPGHVVPCEQQNLLPSTASVNYLMLRSRRFPTCIVSKHEGAGNFSAERNQRIIDSVQMIFNLQVFFLSLCLNFPLSPNSVGLQNSAVSFWPALRSIHSLLTAASFAWSLSD
jgi:hypothetical protein